MKKLSKLKLNDLKQQSILLSKEEQASFVGGDGEQLKISGGTLTNYHGNVIFVGNDGKQCTFWGVQWGNIAVKYSAWQEYGYVGVSTDWSSSGFNVHDFAHEFGHYLQQVEMGGFAYQYNVAIPSTINLLFYGGVGHSDLPYERDAQARGEAYLNAYLK